MCKFSEFFAKLVIQLYVCVNSHGQLTTDQEGFPWHVIMFRLKQGQYVYLCGGSLIERNALITVAHCIVELGSSRSLIDVEELRVVLAPVSSVYNENVASSKAKLFNVSMYVFLTAILQMFRIFRVITGFSM